MTFSLVIWLVFFRADSFDSILVLEKHTQGIESQKSQKSDSQPWLHSRITWGDL